jgi:arginine utilization protein RocB
MPLPQPLSFSGATIDDMLICMSTNNWFDVVRHYTEQLVAIRSVSPSQGEIQAAQAVLDLLRADEFHALYTASGLDPLEDDPYGRQNAYAFLRGKHPLTLVLLGHIDTVDTADYGRLEQWALAPQELAARLDTLRSPAQQSEEEADDCMFGRGVADMKSGVAVNIALMRRLAEQSQHEPLLLSVLILATPDEENESAGVLQAVRFLARLREQYGLTYVGVINTDYGTALYPGDPHHYIYAGTVGKLLPSFLCVGRESHVCTPFQGLDANLIAAELIRDLCMNDVLCDSAGGLVTAPPVTLHATDLKTHYDVQLPFAAYFYLNVLTLTTEPDALLTRLRGRCQAVLAQMSQRISATEHRWQQASGQVIVQQQARSIAILTYAELYAETVQKLGEEMVKDTLSAEWERWPALLDKRERCLRLVQHLWALSGRQGPAVVLYYSPPYYPHVPATPGMLQDAITTVAAAHLEQQLLQREYFPLLSDMSYLQLNHNVDLTALTANMPAWQDAGTTPRPGAYSLPLEAIQQLGMPVFNWGVHGRGAHQRDESIQMSYSFEALPQLLYETIERLALMLEGKG